MSETLLVIENSDSTFIITRKHKSGSERKGWSYKLIRKKKGGSHYQCRINKAKFEIVAGMDQKDALNECYALIEDAYVDRKLMRHKHTSC